MHVLTSRCHYPAYMCISLFLIDIDMQFSPVLLFTYLQWIRLRQRAESRRRGKAEAKPSLGPEWKRSRRGRLLTIKPPPPKNGLNGA